MIAMDIRVKANALIDHSMSWVNKLRSTSNPLGFLINIKWPHLQCTHCLHQTVRRVLRHTAYIKVYMTVSQFIF